ncbi:MAG: hypothetical protein CM1200mP29_13470 [Verrucomicrobiota bacterium]|nr:MAG: hypothetical protein CM1200mP29_13470 [Verrucomicrobiota bacterium]
MLNPEQLQLAKGFKAELCTSCQRGNRALGGDDRGYKGRLIASDQYGIFTASRRQNWVRILEDLHRKNRRADWPARGFSGRLTARTLWGTAAASPGTAGAIPGIDTDGDDQLDKVETLKNSGGVGTWPSRFILTPDGKNLFVIAGNHTLVPDLATRRNPSAFEEDLLLPRHRMPVAMRATSARRGWICQVTPDGKKWDLISSGYRNPYGLALNNHGELFTYDADMEWDYGTPWYRPTRVNQSSAAVNTVGVPDGKWPAHYPDSLRQQLISARVARPAQSLAQELTSRKGTEKHFTFWTGPLDHLRHPPYTRRRLIYRHRETFVAGKKLPGTDLYSTATERCTLPLVAAGLSPPSTE